MNSAASVAIVDTGGANLASLGFALTRLGVSSTITRDPDTITGASHVILPGVGAAGDAMRRLEASGLDRLIPSLTQPVLGICLGMHLLAAQSDEDHVRCLGIFDTPVLRIPDSDVRAVPHMGWNRTVACRDNGLLAGLPPAPYYYYVHSFAICADTDGCTAHYDYGASYAAVIQRDNFVGTQFHPERSAAAGRRLLANFLGRTAC